MRRAVRCCWAASPLLKVCIVGAGPAGLYTAERLIRRSRGSPIQIDVVDRLPFPFGLVETGVAPDHPATKNVRNGFMRVLRQDHCRFFGNVHLGRNIRLAQLLEIYHGVVLACGAELDRKLGVEGENGRGIWSAREFVWWYNGHPDGRHLDVDLSGVRSVAIVGAGNVALDCARILLKPASAFASTDMASHAIAALEASSVKDVHIIARRNVAHVKFTPKELREIMNLPRTRCPLSPLDLKISLKDAKVVRKERSRKRVIDIFKDSLEKAREAEYNEDPFDRTLHFKFSRPIQQIHLNDHSEIQGLTLQDTSEDPFGEMERLDVDMLITCIGTVAARIEGVPFDEDRGIVPSKDGRVFDPSTEEIVRGVYVSGWIKRGATGIIGTNIIDAEDVADAVHEDRAELLAKAPNSTPSLPEILAREQVRYVDLSNWMKLQEIEAARGRERGKPREKTAALDDILDICLEKPLSEQSSLS